MYHLCVLRHSLALGGRWWCLAALKTPLLLLGGSLAFSDKNCLKACSWSYLWVCLCFSH